MHLKCKIDFFYKSTELVMFALKAYPENKKKNPAIKVNSSIVISWELWFVNPTLSPLSCSVIHGRQEVLET